MLRWRGVLAHGPNKKATSPERSHVLLRIIRSRFPLRPWWPMGKCMNNAKFPDQQKKRADSLAAEAPEWLKDFDEHLLHTQGLASRTRRLYCAVVSRFVAGFCGSSAPDWSLLQGKHVSTFVRQEASRLKRGSRGAPAVAIRALLRYLRFVGAVRAGLEASIPRTPRWKQAALPASLSPAEVQRVIGSIATDTRTGFRNRAILLLLARMGLRAVEVAQLTLDDIDWRSGRLWIRKAKSRKERCLPLPQEVCAALHDYLVCGRRPCASRTVFLRTLAPVAPFRNSAAVCKIARRALTRAGLDNTFGAAHLFRHAAATNMLTGGATFNEIADVLGHVCLKTTAIYAKLDLPALSAISMPWPGSRP
jgi:site-specific recombinase XerD